MANILTAIQAIVQDLSRSLPNLSNPIQNRANQMGAALEDYVKNAFANCIGQNTVSVNQARFNTFSYLGNNTNPPDAVLIGGDAIEIKKIERITTPQLQLNSSFPKDKLYTTDPKLCKSCIECEEPAWTVKDLIYVIGQVDKNKIKNLFFIYGDLYCDSPDIYRNVEDAIKDGLKSIDGIEFSATRELGRVNKVDHLGISDLRIRGMWLIKTPFLQFECLTKTFSAGEFKLVALIPENKYDSLEDKTQFETFCNYNNVYIKNVDITDPKNPANPIKSKIIIYSK